jgi:hypothetical protein
MRKTRHAASGYEDMTALPPLLAIAVGKKARARKAPVLRPRESKLHCDVADLLRAHCLPDWKWRWVPMKAANAREGAIWKRMGSKPHWPDIEFISPYGTVRFIELKRTGEKTDDGQDDFRMWCVGRGISHVVAWTIDDVLAACEAWGCLRVKFTRGCP